MYILITVECPSLHLLFVYRGSPLDFFLCMDLVPIKYNTIQYFLQEIKIHFEMEIARLSLYVMYKNYLKALVHLQNAIPRKQHGQMVRVPDLNSLDRRFKSCSDHAAGVVSLFQLLSHIIFVNSYLVCLLPVWDL